MVLSIYFHDFGFILYPVFCLYVRAFLPLGDNARKSYDHANKTVLVIYVVTIPFTQYPQQILLESI